MLTYLVRRSFPCTKIFLFPLVLLSATGGGMIVGSIVSFLNQILHIPFLLAAIVTNGLFHGLTQYCLGTSAASFHLTVPFHEFTLLISMRYNFIMTCSFFDCTLSWDTAWQFMEIIPNSSAIILFQAVMSYFLVLF